MDGIRKYRPEWCNPITKEHKWYVLTDKWILAQKLGIPKTQFTYQMMLKKKEEQCMDTLVLLRRGEQNSHRRRYKDKVWSRVWGKDHPETNPPSDPSHIQLQNRVTITDAYKCLLTGAGYSCHLGDSASAWQIQRGTLSASHWTEHRVPNGGARERTKELKGFAVP